MRSKQLQEVEDGRYPTCANNDRDREAQDPRRQHDEPGKGYEHELWQPPWRTKICLRQRHQWVYFPATAMESEIRRRDVSDLAEEEADQEGEI